VAYFSSPQKTLNIVHRRTPPTEWTSECRKDVESSKNSRLGSDPIGATIPISIGGLTSQRDRSSHIAHWSLFLANSSPQTRYPSQVIDNQSKIQGILWINGDHRICLFAFRHTSLHLLPSPIRHRAFRHTPGASRHIHLSPSHFGDSLAPCLSTEASEVSATNACGEAGAYNSVSRGGRTRVEARLQAAAAGSRHAWNQRNVLLPKFEERTK
jgi:hypothetical protein